MMLTWGTHSPEAVVLEETNDQGIEGFPRDQVYSYESLMISTIVATSY